MEAGQASNEDMVSLRTRPQSALEGLRPLMLGHWVPLLREIFPMASQGQSCLSSKETKIIRRAVWSRSSLPHPLSQIRLLQSPYPLRLAGTVAAALGLERSHI